MIEVLKKKKLEYCDLLILIVLICSFLYGIIQKSLILYIPILAFAFMKFKYGMKIFDAKDSILLILLALIVPDNYLIIVMVLYLYFINIKQHGLKFKTEKILIYTACLIVYILFNLIIHMQNVNNIFFYLLYNLPFLVSALLMMNVVNKKGFRKGDIDYLLKCFVLIQIVAIISYALTHLKIIFSMIDNDWVSGTLGNYHSDVLMIICSFAFLYFLFRINEDRKCVGWAIASAIVALATTSVTYTIALLFAFVIGIVFTKSIDKNKKIKYGMFILLGIIVFYLLSPRWVTAQLFRLFDFNYFQYRIPKIKYYITTFITMPFTEGIFILLFGVGAGLYSSRAAETCAGGYIGIYDKFFTPYSSHCRKKYIESVFNSIDPTHEAKTSLLGSARSSLIAVHGELGLVGTVFLILFIKYLYSGTKNIYKNILVNYFILLMVFESILEFPKMGIVFWIVYTSIRYSENKNTNNDTCKEV